MVGGTSKNQFRQHDGQNERNQIGYNAGNSNGYNAVQNARNHVGQNARNQVGQNAIQNLGIQNVRNHNRLIVVAGIANQNGNGNVVTARAEGNGNGNNANQIRCYNCRGVGYYARKCTRRPKRRDDAYLQTQLLITQKEEAGILLQVEEFDLMADAAGCEEIKEVNENCILMENLQQASTSGTLADEAPVYDLEGLAEVHQYENCNKNEIFNMFT
ncbi:gag-pol polyprotein [Tanacetum coccineum]